MIDVYDVSNGDYGTSKYHKYFSNSVNRYLDKLDIKVIDRLDKYLDSAIRDNTYNILEMKDWDVKWIKIVIDESRKYSKYGY